MNNLIRYLLIACLMSTAQGQISQGGTPYSHANILADSITTINMVSVDAATLLAEDELES